VQLVGDDLFVTNTERIKHGIAKGAEQRAREGEPDRHLTETLESVEMAHRNGWTTIISHRSGETEDTLHRRPGRRHPRGPDQDRLARPLGARREVQPPAPDRVRAGRDRHLGRLARSALETRNPSTAPDRARSGPTRAFEIEGARPGRAWAWTRCISLTMDICP
jgi:hypothetical protein